MPRCHLCARNHQLKYCALFVALTPDLRRQAVAAIRMCTNCLAHTHTRPNCTSLNRCRYCQQGHHSMLHQHPIQVRGVETSNAQPEGVPQAERCIDCNQNSSSQPHSGFIVLPMVCAVVEYNGRREGMLFLIDTEASRSVILRSSAKKFRHFNPEPNPDGQPSAPLIFIAGKRRYNCILQLVDYLDIPKTQPIYDQRIIDHYNNFVPWTYDHFYCDDEFDGVISGKSWEKFKMDKVFKMDKMEVQVSCFGWVIHGEWNGCKCRTHEGREIIRC
ncbi:uncharacterized protein LOC142221636 [Haematobia irritans]|uniref:uncharacterized protein LOC142221636 n=1 Tax=Haematobia irritans TaxID=7368 RepID=UPI003F4F9AF7